MSLQVDCPKCKKVYKLSSDSAGKPVSCIVCQTVFKVENSVSLDSHPPSVPPPIAKPKGSAEPAITTGNRSWILIGGISGGAALLLLISVIVGWVVLNSGPAEPSVRPVTTATKIPSIEEKKNTPDDGTSPKQETPVKDDDTSAAEQVPIVNDESFIVPEKIVELPAEFSGHSLVDFVDEINKLPYEDTKDEFEKTDVFTNRMKAIWPDATLFGQPATNRFAYTVGEDGANIKIRYQADAEKIRVEIGKVFLEQQSPTPFSRKQIRLKNISFPDSDADKLTFAWQCKPDVARNLVPEIRIGFLIRLGARPEGESVKTNGWDFSPMMLTGTLEVSSEAVIDGALVKDDIIEESIDLWAEELSEIILFRHDTGEILQRLDVSTGRKILAALLAEDYAKAASLDPENEDLKKLNKLNAEVKLKPPQCIQTYDFEGADVRGITFSPSGKLIATTDPSESSGFSGDELDEQGPGDLGDFGGARENTRQPVKFDIWDAVSVKQLTTLLKPRPMSRRGRSNPPGPVTHLIFSPDGRWVASGTYDYEIKIWDMSKAFNGQPTKETRPTRTLSKGSNANPWTETESVFGGRDAYGKDEDHLDAMAFSSDGRQLASVNSSEPVEGPTKQNLEIWDLVSGKRVKTLTMDPGDVSTVAFSPDGKWITSGGGGGSGRSGMGFGEDELVEEGPGEDDRDLQRLKIWDVETGVCHKTLVGHDRAVTDVAFSPDGRWLASCDKSGLIRIWNVATWKLHKTLNDPGSRNVPFPWAGAQTKIVFSPDGAWLASAPYIFGRHPEPQPLVVWDIAAGRFAQLPRAHAETIHRLIFSPDGKKLFSGSDDGTIKAWDVPNVMVHAAASREIKRLTEQIMNDAKARYGSQ